MDRAQPVTVAAALTPRPSRSLERDDRVKWSWRIGRVAGIALYVHATFLLLLAWVTLQQYQRGLTAVLGALLYIVSLFAIVVLHELGHALTARRYGIETRDIILLPIGGVARLERMPRIPRQELLVALAGPAVNFALAGVLYVALRLTGGLPSDALYVMTAEFSLRAFATLLIGVNIVLGVFNLLPAFPMDGGRVLRAVLAMRMRSYARATEIAARIGRVLAVVFGLAGLFWVQSPMWVLIALFVWLSAAREAAVVRAISEESPSARVADVMPRTPDSGLRTPR